VIRAFYQEADDLLEHPRLLLTEDDVHIVAASFEHTIQARGYTCYACAIMPDHVHLLIRRHRDKAEEMCEQFQKNSRDALIAAGRRAPTHPVWGGPGRKIFLNSRKDIERIVKYIRENPLKMGLPAQNWRFVKQYDGWLPRRFWEK
jgi:REP element-mobilizing transposase RayT